MESKDAHVVGTDVSSSAPSPIPNDHIKDPDQAYTFLQDIGAKDGVDSELSIKAIRRKVDWRIVPLMFLCVSLERSISSSGSHSDLNDVVHHAIYRQGLSQLCRGYGTGS